MISLFTGALVSQLPAAQAGKQAVTSHLHNSAINGLANQYQALGREVRGRLRGGRMKVKAGVVEARRGPRQGANRERRDWGRVCTNKSGRDGGFQIWGGVSKIVPQEKAQGNRLKSEMQRLLLGTTLRGDFLLGYNYVFIFYTLIVVNICIILII